MTETVDVARRLELSQSLLKTLRLLTETPYSVLDSPTQTKKRASVALIIRIQPSYAHWPPSEIYKPAADTGESQLDNFFSQEWVKHGDPEILFIRRAARKGDRWTSHVALPGGNRDPEDEDDKATAIREAFEEVGVDLTVPDVLSVGNLPQRVVTARWGSKPIMVLCPYIFLLTEPKLPPLRLQPTEVGSAHWVSIRLLLSPQTRTYEYQDVGGSENPGGTLRKLFGSHMLGSMLFAAIRLLPSESTYSNISSTLDSPPEAGGRPTNSFTGILRSWLLKDNGPAIDTDKPLKLWGLTLGVIADLLELLPPHDALELWTYPTFSPPDLRLMIWLMSYQYRTRERLTVVTDGHDSPISTEAGFDTPGTPDWLKARWRKLRRFPGTSPVGLGSIAYYNGLKRSSSTDAVMLVAYYEILRRAILITVAGRGMAMVGIAIALWRRYRLRR